MTLFFLILSYFKGMFFYVIGETNRASLSYQKLFNSSFNLPEKFRYSYKSVLSELRKVVYIPVKLDCHELTESNNNSSIVYDLSDVSKKERIHYLRFYGIENELAFGNSLKFSQKSYFFLLLISCFFQI